MNFISQKLAMSFDVSPEVFFNFYKKGDFGIGDMDKSFDVFYFQEPRKIDSNIGFSYFSRPLKDNPICIPSLEVFEEGVLKFLNCFLEKNLSRKSIDKIIETSESYLNKEAFLPKGLQLGDWFSLNH